MTPAEVITEIVHLGGKIWAEGDRLKFRDVPARLVPAIRDHNAALLALLSSSDRIERAAIQAEGNEVSDHPGKPVPTLLEQAEAVLDHYGADWQRGVADLRIIAKNPGLASLVEQIAMDTTQPARVDSEQDIPLPERVSCGQCVRFQPGTTKMGIGVCLATTNGLPPKEQRGYLAAYPMAPRSCLEFMGVTE